MKILITGAAGFIGSHLVNKLIKQNWEIIGLDNINAYYQVKLKYDRLKNLGILSQQIIENEFTQSSKYKNFKFLKTDLKDNTTIKKLFNNEKFDLVCNLGAQAGVRYSLENPYSYIESNINGFLNILEGCRHNNVKHLVYASSSSVYGLNNKYPFSVEHNVDHPVSLYAASKKSNELMAHSYSHLFNLPTTGLRFFTVYGPWGRPDMAIYKFTKAITENKPIDVYNNGNMQRDFTYIDDIINGILLVLNNQAPEQNKEQKITSPSHSIAPYRIYNIGNNKPVDLMNFVRAIEKRLNKKAKINYMPIQPGDVEKTWADTTALNNDFGYKPITSVEEGIEKFIKWFKNYYQI